MSHGYLTIVPRAISLALLTIGFAAPVFAADPVKIGLLEDESGNFAIAVIPKIHATQLAVEEINAKGGILGRPIKLIHYDTQSDNTRFQEMARRLIQQDKVDVIFGAFSSASREAIRPIMDKAKQLLNQALALKSDFDGAAEARKVLATMGA